MFLPDNSVFVPVTDPNMTLTKTPASVQDPAARVSNFDEVELGYTAEQAMEEAARCLHCPAEYCRKGCPAGNPIPQFISKVRAGEFEAAYDLIAGSNCLPGISGRVCAQERQCELNCTRGIKGEPVAIGRLERFAADWHRANVAPEASKADTKGKSAAVVGSGPAGLTCALELARKGWAVTLYEARDYLGGIPVYGIPPFVLPRDVLAEKLAELDELGVAVQTGVTVGKDVTLEELTAANDAVFVGNGCAKAVRLNVAGEELEGVWSATDYLTAVNVKGEVPAAEKVVVVGGGNTAIDVARCARRSGAQSVTILYRRDEEQMPARRDEIQRAREEGVELVTLAAPAAILGEDKVSAVVCDKMALGAKDWPGGRPNPVKTGETFEMEASLVVLALGYTAEPIPGMPVDEKGRVAVGKDGVTTALAKVYAGGDAVKGAATLIEAMEAGKKAARLMDEA